MPDPGVEVRAEMKRSVPEGATSVRVGSNVEYDRVAARRDGATLTVYGPSWTIALEPADEAALLRALIAQAGGVEVEVSEISVVVPEGFPDGPAMLWPLEDE